MGLIPTARSKMRTASYVVLALLLACVACEQEIEFDDAGDRYLFTDGFVTIGERAHVFTVGRTLGPGRSDFARIPDVAVSLRDVTDDREVDCLSLDDGTYSCTLDAEFDHAYQLTVELPGGRRYHADAAPLRRLPLRLSAEAAVSLKLDNRGNEILGDRVRIQLTAETSAPESSSVLISTGTLGWAYQDNSVNQFEPARICYFEEGLLGDIAAVDLSPLTSSEPLTSTVVDLARSSKVVLESAILFEVSRLPRQALPYARTLELAANQTGSIFSERPYTAVGNYVGEEDADPMLGYFGVREVREVVVIVSDEASRGRRNDPFCPPRTRVTGQYDCQECLRSPGASADPPAWWPF